MKVKEEKADLLYRAFSRFNSVSLDLERSYSLLKKQVRALNLELEAKNQTLLKTLQEKEALKQELDRDQRLTAIGEMALRMAHELRNPLGSIELFSSLLIKDPHDQSKTVEWSSHIRTAVRAMDHALSNMLLFTRKPKARMRTISLTRVLQEAIQFVSYRLKQNKIYLSLSMGSLPESSESDEDLLRQVLVNLVLNAMDAMPQGGRLRISSTYVPSKNSGDPSLTLSVSDNGHGIPENALPKIFDPFFTTKKGGSGLGLAIVYNAVHSLGGSISVKSRPGVGSNFYLRIPLPRLKESSIEP